MANRAIGKKLKRRLEDLERRAGTSDGSSSPPASEKAVPATNRNNKKAASPKAAKPVAAPQKHVAPQFTPPMHPDEELPFTLTYDERERSHTPPFIAYSSYPPPDEMLLPPYGAAQGYHPMTTADGYPTYISNTVPCTLPSMTHFSDAIKREPYQTDESMSPYMNYGFVSGIDVNGPNPYDHSNPHVSTAHDWSYRTPRS